MVLMFGDSVSGQSGSAAPGCGNGVIAGSEECDDGNTDSWDGCSSVCMVEPGYSCRLSNGSSLCHQHLFDLYTFDGNTSVNGRAVVMEDQREFLLEPDNVTFTTDRLVGLH